MSRSAGGPERGDDAPEPGDDPGASYAQLAEAYGWTHDAILRLTQAQINYYLSGGRPEEVGVRRASGSAGARANRRSMGHAG